MMDLVFSNAVAGGMIVPVSSCGTMEVAVVLINHTSTAIDIATIENPVILCLINQPDAVL